MDLMKMMKQARDLQAKMQQMQDELKALAVEGQSGGGAVKVTLNGKGDLTSLRIDPALAKPDEIEILEDLVIAAMKDAKGKVEAAAQAKMQEATAGLPLPPGMKLF
jgi:DNA-binding YbaB/EbfC family protein